MREIKFRLIRDGKVVGYEKHVNSCRTISIMHAKSMQDCWKYIYPDYKHWISHDDKEQYTGLKDKNGVEIYEQDKWCSPHGKIYVVKYGDCRDYELGEVIGSIESKRRLKEIFLKTK